MSPDNNTPIEDKPPVEDLQPDETPVDTNPSFDPEVMSLDREPATVGNDQPESADVDQPTVDSAEGESSTVSEPVSSSDSQLSSSDRTLAAATPAVATTGKPPRKSKRLLVGGIIAAGMVLLLGGGAAAYTLWYQNPQKVVTDAIVNLFKAKSVTLDGTVEITNLGDDSTSVEKMTLTFDSQSTRGTGEMNATLVVTDTNDKDYTLEGSALVDGDSNLYFKVKNIKQLAEGYMGLDEESMSAVETILDKIDDKWVRIAADDYRDISEEASQTQECVAEVFKKYESDDKLQAQVGDAYRNNQFIVIDEELGSRDGSLGYVIDGDADKAKSFIREVQKTDVYQELQKCDDSFDFDVDDFQDVLTTDDSNFRLEVWVSRFGHELTQVKASVSEDDVAADFVMNTKFNQDVTVEAPSDYISLKDLIEDIQRVWMEQAMAEYDISQDEMDAMMEQMQQGQAAAIET